ncbi:MAG: hypothetical protein IKS83_06175 [Victivallales bacterium]|nr:hypothetical protein [Victivallales bacterium]
MEKVSTQERDAFIMECLDGGMSLSELQNQLAERFDLHLTYMELRMLTADLQVNWSKQDAKVEASRPKTKPAPAAATTQVPEAKDASPYNEGADDFPEEGGNPEPSPAPSAEGDALRGATTVEVSKVVRPGAAVSGTVKFGSGASGEWYLDQFGRLGFIPDEGSGKPDQQDIQEFQTEIQKALGGY